MASLSVKRKGWLFKTRTKNILEEVIRLKGGRIKRMERKTLYYSPPPDIALSRGVE
jgi:hypothetical protein